MTCVRFSLKTLLLVILMVATYFAGRASVREKQRDDAINFRVPVSVHFEKTPLRNAVTELGRQANVSVHFDERRFAGHAVDLDHPVTLDLDSHIRFSSALYIVLSPFDLGYYVRNRTVIITDEAVASRARQLIQRPASEKWKYCGVPW